MNPTIPVTIHRSVLGIVGMIVVWFGVNAIALFGLSHAGVDGDTRQLLIGLAVFLGVATFAVLVVSAYLYWAASLRITADGLQVLRYKTLFWSVQSTVTFHDIQEVTVTGAGIFKGLFGVGTLLVQTSAAQPNLAINWIPNVDQWRDYIATKADAADQLTN